QPDGEFADMPVLASQSVTAGILNEDSGHRVASIFEEFLQQTTSMDEGSPGEPLFANPLEEVGAPLTDAYWVPAVVDGEERLVLVQPFENLVLTYTPDNPDGWQVELGNAGRHAFQIQSNQ